MKPLHFLLAITLFVTACNSSGSTHEQRLLQKALVELEKIKYADCIEARATYIPGDTLKKKWSSVRVRSLDNPKDTIVGTIWVNTLLEGDSERLISAYDGEVSASAYDDDRSIILDNFTTRKLPFRPLAVPFFAYARSIVEYALTTTDSIEMSVTKSGELYHLSLTIHEPTQVEFFGRAHHLPERPEAMRVMHDPTSHYQVWFDASTNLPTKIYREMDHNASEAVVSDAILNTLSIEDLNIEDYYPEGYKIRMKGSQSSNNIQKPEDLIGEKAPNFSLKNSTGEVVELSKIASRAILLNFTGIGCTPCKHAIPMLSELNHDYSAEELQVISIESWGKETKSLDIYAQKYNIDYPFLVGEQSILTNYHISGVPIFILLDSSLTVKHVYNGYTPAQSDEQIKALVTKILDKEN